MQLVHGSGFILRSEAIFWSGTTRTDIDPRSVPLSPQCKYDPAGVSVIYQKTNDVLVASLIDLQACVHNILQSTWQQLERKQLTLWHKKMLQKGMLLTSCIFA